MTSFIRPRSVRMNSNSLTQSMANTLPRLWAVLIFDLNYNVNH